MKISMPLESNQPLPTILCLPKAVILKKYINVR